MELLQNTLPFLPSYSCDFGYEGARCEQPTSPAPMTLQETFEDPLVISTSSTVDIAGGLVGYLCGVLASGKAVVFNQAGKRSLTTTELNTTAARWEMLKMLKHWNKATNSFIWRGGFTGSTAMSFQMSWKSDEVKLKLRIIFFVEPFGLLKNEHLAPPIAWTIFDIL